MDEPNDPLTATLLARVQVERAALADEESIERTLTDTRRRALLDGSESQLDDLDTRISASRTKQVRALERIQLIQQWLPNELSHDVEGDVS